MSWEKDPLWSKSKLFFERAFAEDRNEPLFGLWCSLALELLARAALAGKSPALLAAPDESHKHLLHALGLDPDLTGRRSIGAVRVFKLCQAMFDEFTLENFKVATQLLDRRNDELHSGADAFADYPPNIWLSQFYRACQSLAIVLGESLESLFGPEEAAAAQETLQESRDKVKALVQGKIASFRKVFEDKNETDRAALAASAIEEGKKLAYQRHHRVTCPACTCSATVQGETFGNEKVTNEDDLIVVRQPVAPRKFECSACGLKLSGYAQLEEAGLGGHYTRRTEYFPDEYYNLIDPANYDPRDHIDMDSLVRDYLDSYVEFDNE